ncbi:MAG: hypothetical protein HQK81_06285 [Desulfovibrionaceae bacterium]|nr:hypothetical protein [Desulfovibrionaceae bacterium]MBF0513658.1 hypothetical protein [Desulfovibrionaceae bacterium]
MIRKILNVLHVIWYVSLPVIMGWLCLVERDRTAALQELARVEDTQNGILKDVLGELSEIREQRERLLGLDQLPAKGAKR